MHILNKNQLLCFNSNSGSMYYRLWPISVLLLLTYVRSSSSQTNSSIFDIGKTNNSSECGTVPFPFGPPGGTALPGFEVVCISNSRGPAFLSIQTTSGTYRIENISLQGQVKIMSGPIYRKCYYGNNRTESGTQLQGWLDLEGTPYTISKNYTTLIAIGCGDVVIIQGMNFSSGCVTFCNNLSNIIDGSCSGLGCCQAPLPVGLKSFNLQLNRISKKAMADKLSSCTTAFFVTPAEYSFKIANFSNQYYFDGANYPVVLDWAIGNKTCQIAREEQSYACRKNSRCYNSPNGVGYLCICSDGYQGNPYDPDGCTDINECELPDVYPCNNGNCKNEVGSYRCIAINKKFIIIIGIGTGVVLLILVQGVLMLIKMFKGRRLKITRKRWFKQNHGLLLQQLVSSNEYIGERMKIFSLEELEKATNKFDATLVVGHGGHGVVYKGILSDQRVVAIKKSQIVVQSEIDQFINEVAILSQIDHRNVVKLHGCCLESEVPLLVYEFISNGTLWGHLHVEGNNLLSWENRFRIALEIARALSHLHSTASISIFHRDVKSSNILLDDYLTAKVSDFGASRLIQIDHTGITTAVQGTFGYLDPEYFHTGRLTEKSDVYSFGVILAELLTRVKPISSSRFQQGENLAGCFCSAMRESYLNEIIDPEITGEEHREEIEAVALLAETCLRMKGEERPTMKEIETRLQVLNGFKKRHLCLHPWREEGSDERESVSYQLVGGDNSRQYSLESELVSSAQFPR
ncbi:hypothetical protein LUZ60_003335 [Juncus effusus]|nr:hypothetical protein LUZ60_003335 [Juncus effusus]